MKVAVDLGIHVLRVQEPGQVALNDLAQPHHVDDPRVPALFLHPRIVVRQPIQKRRLQTFA